MITRWQRLWQEMGEGRKRRKEHATIDLKPDGFVFARKRKPVTMDWSDVTEIAGGTHAMITGELFYVVIAGGGHRLEINEYVDGFSAFEQALFERFPSVRERILKLQTTPSEHERFETMWKTGDAR